MTDHTDAEAIARLPDAAARRLPDFIRTLRINREKRRESVYASDNVYALLDALDTAEARVRELEAEEERDALHAGLSAIIHCQSRLSRSEMREAAADLLDKTGLKPKWLGGDQSPFVRRALAAEARVRELEAEIADTYERCAKVADKIADEHSRWKGDAISADVAEQVAAAIRQLAKEVKHEAE